MYLYIFLLYTTKGPTYLASEEPHISMYLFTYLLHSASYYLKS
jgi:hypothetical protein